MSRSVIALAAVTALALSNVTAFAHAELASANPPANGTVKAAPTEVSITFTEEVEPKFSNIEVLNDKNQRVEQGKAQTLPNDAKTLHIAVKPLTAGIYKVIWQAVSSDDSHKTKGTYEFTIKP